MNSTLLILGLAVASVTLNMRIEPSFPQVASDLGISLHSIAILATAFGLAYALVQPIMGVVADRYGKQRVMVWGLTIVGLFTLACAFATSFEFLFISRMIVGAAAGGIAPASLSLAADLSTPGERQIAISRVVLGSTTGSILGAIFAGVLSDLIGWRGMFCVAAAVIGVATVILSKRLQRLDVGTQSDPGSLSTVFSSYMKILRHKTAIACFLGVLIESATIFGLFPYVPAFLQEQGETRLSIGGLIIAAFSLGVFFYIWTIGALLSILNVRQLMVLGAFISASQIILLAFGLPWPIQMASFAVMGFGCFLLHGAFQAFATEVSTVHRGKVLAFHSLSYFAGQGIGTIVYGYALLDLGKFAALGAGAAVVIVGCCICAVSLVNRPEVT